MLNFYKAAFLYILNWTVLWFAITNHLLISHLSPPAPRGRCWAVLQHKRDVCSPWPTVHGVQKVAVCIWYYLGISGVITLTSEEWEWIWRGCFDVYVGAVYNTSDLWESSYSKNIVFCLLVSTAVISEAYDSKKLLNAWPVSYLSLKGFCGWNSECAKTLHVRRHGSWMACDLPKLRLQIIAKKKSKGIALGNKKQLSSHSPSH